MTLVGVNVRRTLQLLLAVVLLFGATSVIASQRADAAYPGGNEWIVFVDSFDIWAIRADGTGLTNLTNTPGELEADPAFSADGTKIAYAADPGTGESAIYIASFQNAGTLTPSLGSATQVSSGPIDGAPTWSPAGDYVAFQRKLPNVTGTATTDNAGGTTLIDSAAAFDTTDRVAVGDIITNTTNNSTGAVVSVDSATQITMTALTGGTAQTWTTDDGYSISHINRQIFKSATTGSDLTGTRLSQPDSDLTYTDQDPAWSADGTKIAFTSTQALGNADILTMSATDGSSRTNLTDDTTSFDHVAAAPCWSPDSSRVAFQIATTDNENIWTVAAAGGSPVQVTTGTGDEVDPAWSPDGTLIAFRNATDDKLYVTASGGGGTPARVGSAATPATNSAPDWRPTLKAVADTATVAEGGSVNIDVLANDLTLVSNVGTATTSSTLAASPTKGTAVRQGDGSFLYTHSGSEIGASSTTDTFTYTLTQGALTSTAVVTVTITPVNDSPTAVNDEYSVANGGTLTVTAANGVLANDSDPEGVTLTAAKASDPAHGTLTLNGNGSFTYVNDGANTAASTDSFTYTASDGTNTSAPATVTISVASTNPDAPTVAISGPAFGAPGVSTSFSSTVNGYGSIEYAWTAKVGGSTVATGTDATFSFAPVVTGTYTVAVTVTDGTAQSGNDSVEMTVLTDVSSTVFKNDIVWLANAGVTKGCNPPTNDQYCPNDNVTRGQMAAFLVRFLNLTDDGGGDLFTDDDGSVFEHNIDILATAGITKGCTAAGDEFCPNAFVTRGQMAAFLVRAFGLTDDGGGNLFTDDNGSVFEHNIDILATAGITKGCSATEFCPNAFVTRGQMAAFLHRADGLK